MTLLLRAALLAALLAAALPAAGPFHLKDGDRVVFYGDSITDQRLYTTFVETYVVTRFPRWSVSFTHSGWGGDRVTGGAGGGVVERLNRDVFAYKPTVVTVMLGMNDGRVRAFDPQIFDIYSTGYRNIVKRLKEGAPGVRITAIQPSPYDDVTREPRFPGGYNAVLVRYGQFLRDLASAEGLTLSDLNAPVTAMLERARSADPDLAQKIIPDRVHPGASGHLIMAGALLKAWNAPALVSSVEIDAAARRVLKSEKAAVAGAEFSPVLSWTQTDESLPVPIDFSDAVMALAVNSSDFQQTLNRQALTVVGLKPGDHTLLIDGDEIAVFTAAQLAAGVNLAGFKTPMYAQAARVHSLTLKHNNVHAARWRNLQVPLAADEPAALESALATLDALDAELAARQRAAAQPRPHQFELRPGGSAFEPLFNGADLSGWHISQVNHHGTTQAWRVDKGVITAAQDKPGNGGILLTNRSYRDFEVSLEINPDYGCDSGLFLRSNEKGEAYQVLLDYLDGGYIGGVYGERLKEVRGFAPDWRPLWKSGEWNHLRARIEGAVPHIQVWLNGIQITDWRDTANHLPGGASEGMIALQVHGGNRWIPGAQYRFRNLSIKTR
jgi:lysophospholipase L1-like esterase